MAQATTMRRVAAADQAAGQAGAGGSLTCECWDCRSRRHHLLKLTAMVILACGLGGEVAWQRGLWRAGADAAGEVSEPAGPQLAFGAEPF